MNVNQRKELNRAASLLDDAKAQIEEAMNIIECVRDEEQEYFDNMPENMQSNSEKGVATQTAISALEDVHSDLEDIDLDEIINQIEEAKS